MGSPSLWLIVLLSFLQSAGANIQLSNNGLSLILSNESTSFGALLSVQQAGRELLTHPTQSLWSTSFAVAGSGSLAKLDGKSPASHASQSNSTSAVLRWIAVPIPGASSASVDVSLALQLTSEGECQLQLTVGAPVGAAALWSYAISVRGVDLDNGSALLENSGFGIVHQCPGCGSFSTEYPQGTFQFIGKVPAPGLAVPGLYLGCHDATGASKAFSATVVNTTAEFSVTSVVENAGVTGAGGFASPVVLLAAHHADWFEMAQIYRRWALSSASWTRAGPLRQRPDVPAWLLNVTTWINSHWQGNDVFNVSGGDPQLVLQRVRQISARFGPGIGGVEAPLGLHWYEWDTLGYKPGSNYTQCDTEVTCGFDTHYPEYFPVRSGFQSSLAAMQALGVRVAPYINGRIFDQATSSWSKDNARRFAAKNVASPGLLPPSGPTSAELELYDEQYGSQAKFAVMCPHTAYWQDTIAGVTDKLVNGYGTDGVYIDQIAAAGPRPCWDPSHNHSLGGGDHWVTGYRSMLRQVRRKVGPGAVLLTESNAEPFMDGVNVFLTLVGFSGAFVGPSHIVPVFQAIYGGYFLAAGAEYFTTDFAPDPDVFASKLAKQFTFGAQMGWFSLGGRSNQQPPMGIYEQLLDPAYDLEVAYLQRLSEARTRGREWFVHGRIMRELPLVVNGTNASEALPYDSVSSSSWLDASGKSLMVAMTTVRRYSPAFSLQFQLDMRKYGFEEASDTQKFRVSVLLAGGAAKELGEYGVGTVRYQGVLAAREVTLLSIEPIL